MIREGEFSGPVRCRQRCGDGMGDLAQNAGIHLSGQPV